MLGIAYPHASENLADPSFQTYTEREKEIFRVQVKNEAKAYSITLSLRRWRNKHRSLNEKVLQIFLSDGRFMGLDSTKYTQRSTRKTAWPFCERLVISNFAGRLQNLIDDAACSTVIRRQHK